MSCIKDGFKKMKPCILLQQIQMDKRWTKLSLAEHPNNKDRPHKWYYYVSQQALPPAPG